jgi:hypothetical protein
MNIYGGQAGDEWSASRPGRFNPRDDYPIPDLLPTPTGS